MNILHAMHNTAFDDIPGTYVFTGERAIEGRHLNRFCMSLMSAANRARFKADERAYLDEWPMTESQKQAVLKRDFKALLAQGGNIFFVLKIAAVDGRPTQSVAASFAGQSTEEYAAMMRSGGRNPTGLRSISGRF
jgi:protocatechuate 4,5-dioxygenase alpha chain